MLMESLHPSQKCDFFNQTAWIKNVLKLNISYLSTHNSYDGSENMFVHMFFSTPNSF